eukprot:m.12221 g.12221  ORF g.12221 m.12221 type:complete len:299 (+) comp4617_c0_seq1:273-1169(+)
MRQWVFLGILIVYSSMSTSEPIICTHHKTGTTLAGTVFRRACAMAPFNLGCDPNAPEKGTIEKCCPYKFDWQCSGKLQGDTVVHFARNPVNEIVSAYHFHKAAKESWTKFPLIPYLKKCGQQQKFRLSCRKLFSQIPRLRENEYDRVLHKLGIKATFRPQESYSGMLQKLSIKDGLALQMYVSTSITHRDMKKARSDYSQKSFKEVCLEDFMRNAESYRKTWTQVFGFLKLPATSNIMEMVDKHGPGAKKMTHYKMGHMDRTASDKKASMKRYVREIDKELFNGSVAAFEEELGCPES